MITTRSTFVILFSLVVALLFVNCGGDNPASSDAH